ncbi:glycosyltransferase family protein [Alkalitalea saponilacus]|uniref:Diacylglycerol glucosyltransferase N-terminal domain-containing protein n=1 Tax=Alkalitalea saponilacus TaxID=889453 RepID=A0A1T5HS58_9BACT|nr:hypothetical protein [Alkalitalea saponilacus]ASB48303.1 hypothetical protein CDL62_03665 [Alkalitalea saponilacus]SKC23526.1 hypothetical protein SAMN03080601_02801 [Alkalitalea saponilacus]
MKKVALFLPDGVGIRNYLFSRLISNLIEQKAQVVLIASLSDKAIEEAEKVHGLKFEVVQIPEYREGILEKFYRELENISRLRVFQRKLKNPTIIPDHEWGHLTKYRGIVWFFYFFIRFISNFTANYSIIKSINNRYLSRVAKSGYLAGFETLLNEVKPDVILCTHQRAITASPLFESAKKAGIETATAIYSWDNLPKARMAFRAGKYLVWSQYMKDEVLFYYPDINPDDVVITGTPQFEFYRQDELLMSREQFCTEYGFDTNRPIVCYSGGDRLTSPYDQDYLEDLAVAVKTLPEEERPQILFRRCPVDWSPRFDHVIQNHADVIKVVDPLWAFEKDEAEKWTLTYPLFSDVKLLANVARHCDLVYNVGSTMAHDYSMFDKPACYINYNPENSNGTYSVEKIYKYQHFRSMPSSEAVIWVNSKQEIAGLVANAVRNPQQVATQRKAWLQKVILHPVTEASGNIAGVLLNSKS